MHHPSARLAIVRILAGSGFAEGAILRVLAARLADDATCPEALRQRLIESALAAPPDEAPPYHHPLNQQPAPDDAAELSVQLAPALIAHPAEPALGAACLWALGQLWPHVAADERPLLRTRLLNSLTARRADEVAMLTAFQLREWQKQVPTHYGTLTPSVASLRSVLDADQALSAYLLLAEHLGMTIDLETLCWVLGSLGMHLLHAHHDPQGDVALAVLGATACEQLVPHLPADHLVTVISQLNHRLWWLKRHGRLDPIRASTDRSQRPLVSAVGTGDITLAQRAARLGAAQQPTHFWADAWNAIDGLLPAEPGALLRLLALLDAARWRADADAVAVDDAAAIASVLTDLAWRRQHRATPQ